MRYILKFIKSLLFLFCFVLVCLQSYSQIVADFTISQSAGCAPLTVSFQDNSQGNGITFREWDFGNGNVSSGNNSSPSVIYLNPGFYDIKLTVSDGVDTSVIVKPNFVHAVQPPSANITLSDTMGCVPLLVNFGAIVNVSGGPVQYYEWDYADGSPIDSNQNGSHNFLNQGNYFVTLKITDSLGCVGVDSFNFPIQVHQPLASFHLGTPSVLCDTITPIEIINTSNGTGQLSASWFINGQNYPTFNWMGSTSQPGFFDVQMTITDSLGCSDTAIQSNFFEIRNLQLPLNFPDTVCPGKNTSFQILNASFMDVSWDFPSKRLLLGNNVNVSLDTSGFIPFNIYVDDRLGCLDTINTQVNVDLVKANFWSYPTFSCQSPMVVEFVNQSVGNIASQTWRLGSGTVGWGGQVNDTISSPGVYSDTLEVISHFGCKDTFVKVANDTLEIKEVLFQPDVFQGCAPLHVNFQNLTDPKNIKRVDWNFDTLGGLLPHSYAFSPSFTFNKPGVYTVKLEVFLENGCVSSATKLIYVGTKQNADFSIDTNWACASKRVGFTNLSSNLNLIDSYRWDFSDGTYSSKFEPVHAFKDTGYLDVTLMVGNMGCLDTLTIDSAIYINGPVLSFRPIVDCENPNNYEFKPSQKGGGDLYWNYGDLSPIDTTNSATSHSFSLIDSNYSVTLYAMDTISGCKNSFKKLIKVRFLQGVIKSSDSILCKNQNFSISTHGSVNAIQKVIWSKNNFASNWADDSLIVTKFKKGGLSKVSAIVMDINGCRDTLQTVQKVMKLKSDFNLSTNAGCSPLAMQFMDNSDSDTTIVSWRWNFGDGTTSHLKNPAKSYSVKNDTYFDISLVVVDTLGCTHVKRKKKILMVSQPTVLFRVNNMEHCFGDTLNTSLSINAQSSYIWNFGDGTSSSLHNPSKSYGQSGQYSIEVSTINKYGCKDTLKLQNDVIVHPPPSSSFTVNQGSFSCYPAGVTFTNSNPTPNTTRWSWNFGEGNEITTNSLQSVYHNYGLPGNYSVSLITQSQFGCKDSTKVNNFIEVNGPSGVIYVDKETECLKKKLKFELSGLNNTSHLFVWDFGDGVVDTVYNSTPIFHKFNQERNYNVTLLVSDSSFGCMKSNQKVVSVLDVKAKIHPEDTVGCMPEELLFVNASTHADMSIWAIGKNQNIIGEDLQYTFTDTGEFEVSLHVWNDSVACRDTAFQMVTIYPTPQIETKADTTICEGSQVELRASGGNSYSWFPGNLVSDSTIANPITQITASKVLYLRGLSMDGCENLDSISVHVIHPSILIDFPKDTLIIQGNEINVTALANQEVSFLWESSEYMSCTDCFDPYIVPENDAHYYLTFEDTLGCFTSDTSFYVELLPFSVFIPNSFSPNNDGLNDLFKPVFDGVSSVMYFYIYDRWGGLVYESNEIDAAWDGKVKGSEPVINSKYFYKLKVVGDNSKSSEFVGDISIVGF